MTNLEKLYELVIEEKELTTKLLKQEGFSQYEITKMVNDKILVREKRGLYSLDADGIYDYGRGYLNLDRPKARKIFHTGYSINPKHEQIGIQLMIEAIEQKDYEKGYCYLKNIFNAKSPFLYNYNLYLYLFSNLIELDYDDREYTKLLEYDDVALKDVKTADEANNIRYHLMIGSFAEAIHLLNSKRISNRNNNYVSEIITYSLTSAVEDKRNKLLTQIKEQIDNDDYDSIVSTIEEEERLHRLDWFFDSLLNISKDIITMRDENQIPEKVDLKYTDVSTHSLIYNRNYKMALERQKVYSKSNKVSTQVLLKLLQNVVDKENEIEQTSNSEVESMVDEVNDTSNISYESLMISLLNQDYDNFFNNLKFYLENINHKELEPVIIDIIKLNLQEQKDSSEAVGLLLTRTFMKNYEFNLDYFLNIYYANVYLGNTDIAEKYLEFIKKYKDLTNDTISIDKLGENLEVDKKTGQNLFIVEPRIESHNNIEENKTEEKVDKKVIRKKSVEYFESKASLLSERNPIEILKPMSNSEIKAIYAKAENYDDIIIKVAFIDGERRILLKRQYTDEESKTIDFIHISDLANEMYKDGDYDKAMALYKKCICHSYNPNPFLYNRVGCIYLLRRGKEKKKAIPYFEAAVSTAIKTHHKNLQYYLALESVIFSLKYDMPEEERKNTSDIHMEEFEFYDDMNDHYGIDAYEDVVALIDEEHKSIEEACLEFNLTAEDINIMKLIYVRNYYSERFYDKGDELYKEVERSTNKTSFVNSLMNEIRTNKKLYQHRESVKMKTQKNN